MMWTREGILSAAILTEEGIFGGTIFRVIIFHGGNLLWGENLPGNNSPSTHISYRVHLEIGTNRFRSKRKIVFGEHPYR